MYQITSMYSYLIVKQAFNLDTHGFKVWVTLLNVQLKTKIHKSNNNT